jgi:hypothetical protein
MKHRIKQVCSFAAAAILVSGLPACGGGADNSSPATVTSGQESIPTTSTTPAPTTTPTAGQQPWTFGSTGEDFAKDVAVAPDGDRIVVGYVGGSTSYDPLGSAPLTLTNLSGVTDMVFSRFGKDGTRRFAFIVGGSGPDMPHSVVMHPDGGFVVVGYFTGTANFNPLGTTRVNAVAVGDRDGFVARYDATGHALWVRSIGGTGIDETNDAAVLPNGDIVIAGMCADGCTSSGTVIASQAGNQQGYIMRLAQADGTLVWSHELGSNVDTSTSDSATAVVTDGSGNIYLSGVYSGTLSLGSLSTTSNNGSQDVFLLALDSSGTGLWSRSWGSTLTDIQVPGALAFGGPSGTEGLAIAVRFQGTMTSGSTTLTRTSGSGTDIALIRLDLAGNQQWVRQLGGPADDNGHRVSITSNGDVLVAGSFQQSLAIYNAFGASEQSLTAYSGGGNSDGFVARWSGDGNLRWVRHFGSPTSGSTAEMTMVAGMSPEANGNDVVTVGRIYSTTQFETGTGTTTRNFTSKGGADMFVATYSSDGSLR